MEAESSFVVVAEFPYAIATCHETPLQLKCAELAISTFKKNSRWHNS